MKINEILSKKRTLSFEIFPPKKESTNINSIYETIDELSSLNPDFISVTYGAMGSTTKNTLEIAKYIKNNEYELECSIIEEYIKVLSQNELLVKNFIDSDAVDDDELVDVIEDEEEDKPKSKKKSKKATAKKLAEKKHSIKITKDTVSIDGEDLKTDKKTVKNHIIRSIKSGVTKTVYHKFLSKVKNNPKKYIEDELFKFLESGNFPIADDGDFYAFKKIESDYKDNHSHSMDNRPGKIVTMSRKDVCEDRHVTCSTGLHFASLEYAKDYSGTRLMIVKVNPKDVVSIPNDYNNQKGRCCRYKVICEISDIDELNTSTKEFLKKIQTIETKSDKILKNDPSAGEVDFIQF